VDRKFEANVSKFSADCICAFTCIVFFPISNTKFCKNLNFFLKYLKNFQNLVIPFPNFLNQLPIENIISLLKRWTAWVLSAEQIIGCFHFMQVFLRYINIFVFNNFNLMVVNDNKKSCYIICKCYFLPFMFTCLCFWYFYCILLFSCV
jgi:hypothetical protein